MQHDLINIDTNVTLMFRNKLTWFIFSDEDVNERVIVACVRLILIWNFISAFSKKTWPVRNIWMPYSIW